MNDIISHSPLILGGLIILFAFSNGFRDASTIVATAVSTKTMSPRRAFFLCSVSEFCGVLFFGSAVVMTISQGLFGPILGRPRHELIIVLTAGTSAALLWGVVSWWRAWPISNKHAIIGGLFGGSLAIWGPDFFHNLTFTLILVVLIFSPIIGFLFSILMTFLFSWTGEFLTPQVKGIVHKVHMGSCLLVSFAHGSNDGQLVLSLLVLAFGLAQANPEVAREGVFFIPLSLRLAVAAAISMGVLMGGYRILRKLGMSFYRIRLTQGVGAMLTSAATVLGCSFAGLPASTTQVITGSIVGAGVAKNVSAVRWGIAEEILIAWAVTVPSVGLIAMLLAEGLRVGWGRWL